MSTGICGSGTKAPTNVYMRFVPLKLCGEASSSIPISCEDSLDRIDLPLGLEGDSTRSQKRSE